MSTSDKNKSLPAAIQEIKALDAELHCRRFAQTDFCLEAGRLVAGGKALDLDEAGFERLARHVGAPHRYLQELPDELRCQVLGHHIAKGDLNRDGKHATLCVYWRGSVFVGFGRADLATLRGADVADALQAGIENVVKDKIDNIIVHRKDIRSDSFELDLVSPELSEEILPKDVMQAGLRVSHSLTGEHATQIETFILRLLCENGLVRRECAGEAHPRIRRRKHRNRDAIDHELAEIRRVTHRLVRALRGKLRSIKELTEKRVSVREFLDRQLHQVPRLHSRKLLNTLMEAWVDEGSVSTAYGALNAMTRVATHSEKISSASRQGLAALAGVIGTSGQHFCEKCYSVL